MLPLPTSQPGPPPRFSLPFPVLAVYAISAIEMNVSALISWGSHNITRGTGTTSHTTVYDPTSDEDQVHSLSGGYVVSSSS